MELLWHYIGFFAQYLLPAIGAGLTVWIFAVAEIGQRTERIEALEKYVDYLEDSLDQAHERELSYISREPSCAKCGSPDIANAGGVHICKDCGANQNANQT